jgi:hypothetical protein
VVGHGNGRSVPPSVLDAAATTLDDLRYLRLAPDEWREVGTLVEALAAALRVTDSGAVGRLTPKIGAFCGGRVDMIEARDEADQVRAPEPLLERIGIMIDEIAPRGRDDR